MLCSSNLRQIAIAAHNYHNDYGRLPPGYLGPIPNEQAIPAPGSPLPNNCQQVGVLAILLPYLELDNIAKQIVDPVAPYGSMNLGVNSVGLPWYLPGTSNPNFAVAQAKVKLFLCPSDTQFDAVTGVTMSQHVYNNNTGFGYNITFVPFNNSASAAIPNLGRSNYFGSAGAAGRGTSSTTPVPILTPPYNWSMFEGVLCNRSQVSLGQLTVQDGTSNTLMFGEKMLDRRYLGQFQGDDNEGYTSGWDHDVIRRTDRLPEADTVTKGWGEERFGSSHTGGFNAANADGSVRFIRFTVSLATFAAYGTRSNGEVLNANEL
jgi:hypothetical protein